MSYWQNKVAIVTGASSGLGRVMATTLARAGAQLVLAARGVERLETAAAELRAAGHSALALPTDVTRDADVEALIRETIARCGRIDLLVNNAGASMRRAVLDTTPDDFREQFELNVLSAVRATRAAATHLIAARGHVVNIGSLAGKAPARYMGAYGPSKAALVSYTAQLRLELGSQGLHVLLVCPGPIVRDEPRVRSEAELVGLPESARRPGAGVKTSALAPEWLAAKILAACERRQAELVVPRKARLLFALAQLSPSLGDYLIRRMS